MNFDIAFKLLAHSQVAQNTLLLFDLMKGVFARFINSELGIGVWRVHSFWILRTSRRFLYFSTYLEYLPFGPSILLLGRQALTSKNPLDLGEKLWMMREHFSSNCNSLEPRLVSLRSVSLLSHASNLATVQKIQSMHKENSTGDGRGVHKHHSFVDGSGYAKLVVQHTERASLAMDCNIFNLKSYPFALGNMAPANRK